MRFLLSILLLIPTLAFAQQHDMQFFKGYTRVKIYNYDIKITAEQRYSDKVLQVVVIPQEQGIHFDINNVQVLQVPSGLNVTGPAVTVEGVATVMVSQNYPKRIQQAVPVQVALVSRFTVEEERAEMLGYSTYRVVLPKMLSR